MQQGIAGLFAYSKPNPSTPYHCLFPHCNITFSCVYHFADHVANAYAFFLSVVFSTTLLLTFTFFFYHYFSL